MFRSKTKRTDDSKIATQYIENHKIDNFPNNNRDFISIGAGSPGKANQTDDQAGIKKYIDTSSTPSSFFNDPNILKTYINNKIQEARSLQTADSFQRKRDQRNVVSNQESYRKMVDQKSHNNKNRGFTNSNMMTQSSFFKKKRFNIQGMNGELMRQNTIVKINPDSKKKLSTTQDNNIENAQNLEETS